MATVTSIRSQYVVYQELKVLRAALPEESSFEGLESYIGKLIRVAAFDLAQERISSFSAFRFLYERLLGPDARPLAQLPPLGRLADRPAWRIHDLRAIGPDARIMLRPGGH